ncbi:MAG: hypothetical protein NWR72_06685 [Bacteroidia bacterium]|nr:hypothetical protein [Bacteroidia bacterium]
MNRKSILPLIFLGSLLCSSPVFAQSPLFASEDLLSVRITGDWGKVLNDRGGDPDYHDVLLSYADANGAEQIIGAEVKVRGAFRRDPVICDFPPIRLKFDKDDDIPGVFAGQRKLKMVTHCQADEYILREYYIYRMYQLVSNMSFLVRLAKIDYVDATGELPTATHYAFFIEDDDEMAQRLGAVKIDSDVDIRADDVDLQALLMVHLFQYMVANQDFDVSVRQNVEVITNPEIGGRPIVVPYDFDWSGLVNASYTVFNPNSKVTPYEKRQTYKVLCVEEEILESTLNQILDKQDAIWALYETSPYLSKESIDEALSNLKTFFKQAGKSKTREEVFLHNCNVGE